MIRSFPKGMSLPLILFSLFLIPHFCKSDENTMMDSSSSSLKEGIVTIPLIPHHVIQKRRRNRNRNRHLREVNGEEEMENEKEQQQQERPHRYPRFLFQQQQQQQRKDEEDDDEQMTSSPPEAQQVAELFQGYGTHYVDLWCGTPPQRQTVIVDTGSGMTAFPCNECTDCGAGTYHTDALFDQDKSSTFQKVHCGRQCVRGSCDKETKQFCKLTVSYTSETYWTAFEAIDSCYIGGLHPTTTTTNQPPNNDNKVVPGSSTIEKKGNNEADNDNNNESLEDILNPIHAQRNFSFDLQFACQTRLSGLFKKQLADGIMGMDQVSYSFWKQMYNAHKLDKQAFSMCFSRSPHADRDGTEAGVMTMGGTDIRLHKTHMVYAKGNTAGRGNQGRYYGVQIRKVYLLPAGSSGEINKNNDNKNNKKTPRTIIPLEVDEDILNKGDVIVDSGTTDSYFHKALRPIFNQAFFELTNREYDHKPFQIDTKTGEKSLESSWPTILIQLYGDEQRNQVILDRYYYDNSTTTRTTKTTGLANEFDPDHPLDVILAIPPSHYVEYRPEKDDYTARFYVDEYRDTVLGANSMMGHDILFDMDHQIIGIAESNCQYSMYDSNTNNNNNN